MKYLRAFITGAVVGFVLGLAMAVGMAFSDGRLSGVGVSGAIAAIEWFHVVLLTAIFSVGWTVSEFRVFQVAREVELIFDLVRGLWRLLTFWW